MTLNEIKIDEILLRLKKIELFIQENQKNNVSEIETLPEWINLEKAAELKGGKLNTYRTRPLYQPLCGIPEGKVNGRRVWRRETVLEWLNVTDEQLEEYKKKSTAFFNEKRKAVANAEINESYRIK